MYVQARRPRRNYTNLHSAPERSKHDSLAGVIADLLLGLFQLKKQVRRADVYFYVTSADTRILRRQLLSSHLRIQSHSLQRVQCRLSTSVANWSPVAVVVSL